MYVQSITYLRRVSVTINSSDLILFTLRWPQCFYLVLGLFAVAFAICHGFIYIRPLQFKLGGFDTIYSILPKLVIYCCVIFSLALHFVWSFINECTKIIRYPGRLVVLAFDTIVRFMSIHNRQQDIIKFSTQWSTGFFTINRAPDHSKYIREEKPCYYNSCRSSPTCQ